MTKSTKHYTATVVVLNPDASKILLLHHRKFGMWMPPGGHQQAGENLLETAIREVQEETGLDITAYLGAPRAVDDHAWALPLPNYFFEEKINAHGSEPEHYHLDAIFVAKIPEQAVVHAAAESHGIGWFTVEQLSDLPMFDNVRIIAKQELAQ